MISCKQKKILIETHIIITKSILLLHFIRQNKALYDTVCSIHVIFSTYKNRKVQVWSHKDDKAMFSSPYFCLFQIRSDQEKISSDQFRSCLYLKIIITIKYLLLHISKNYNKLNINKVLIETNQTRPHMTIFFSYILRKI